MQAMAIFVEGIHDPQTTDGGDAAVLFVEGMVDDVSVVSDLSGFLTLNKLSWIPVRKESFSGFNWGATPRDPFGKPSPITVELSDKDNLLGFQFREDMETDDTAWYKLADTRVTRSQITFRCEAINKNSPAPSVDSYLWLRNECLFITNVAGVGAGTGIYDIEVDRAQCGSRALAHQLRPKGYPLSSTGIDQALYFSSRPDLDRQFFPARVYCFDVTGSTVTSVRIKSFGYLSQRPRPTGKGWTLVIEPEESRMLRHKLGGGKADVALSRCLRVTDATVALAGLAAAFGAAVLPPGKHPKAASAWMTRLEAEYVFGETLHILEGGRLDIGTLDTRIAPACNGTLPWQFALGIEAGGWSGLMGITSILGYFPNAFQNFEAKLQVNLSLIEAWEGSIGDAPVEAIDDADHDDPRIAGLNPGWTNRIDEKLRPEEAPPKVTLWLISSGVTQAEALLYLFASGEGDGENDATYDALPCGFGFDGDMARLNKGAASGDPINVDPGTSLLLELNELLPEKLQYRFKTGDTWGDWLVNESLASCCLWVPEPATGKPGWRQMDRPGPSSVATLNPLRSSKYKVEPGTRLPAVESIRFEVGYWGKDNDWQDFRILTLAQADSYRDGEKQPSQITIRYWKRGNFFSPGALNSGRLPRLSNFYFRQLKAAPSVFKVPASLLRGPVKVGDFLSWSDDSIQTVNGRGLVDRICQVIAQDSDTQSGPQWLVLLPYALSIQRTATGKIAPALLIIESLLITSTSFDVWCVSVGDPTVDLTTAYNGLFTAIAAASGRLRIVTPSRHNPNEETERDGWLEASCVLSSVESDGGVHKLRIGISGQWSRFGQVNLRRDLLKNNEAYLLLSDRRPTGANTENIEIMPPAAQRKGAVGNVLDAATFAPASPQQPYDGYYYLFS